MSGINKHVIYCTVLPLLGLTKNPPHHIFSIPQHTQAFQHTPKQRKAQQLLLYCEEGWYRRREEHNQHNVKGHGKKGLLACANVISRISSKQSNLDQYVCIKCCKMSCPLMELSFLFTQANSMNAGVRVLHHKLSQLNVTS